MSFKFENLMPDSVKEKFFEDDTPAPQTSAPLIKLVPHPIPPAASFTITPDTSASFPISPITIAEKMIPPNPMLDELRARIGLEATPLGKQLHEVLEALSDSGMTEDQKIKTALKIGHITPESVVETLNSVQQLLTADKQKFEAQMSTAETSEVLGRQQKIAGLDSQISELESQLNAARQQKMTLAAELGERVSKIAMARTNYTAAYETRKSEVDQMATHYQQISLQGKR